MMYGLRWKETDRNDQIVTKEKDFRTEQERADFITKLEGKDNFIEVVAYAKPRADLKHQHQHQQPRQVECSKVVTDRNPDFYYVGASSQIEIAFRDYMNWVTKGKAPKAIQEEADRHNRNPEIFRFEVLEEMEGSRAELNERKKTVD